MVENEPKANEDSLPSRWGWPPDWWLVMLFVLVALIPFGGLWLSGTANGIELGIAAAILTIALLGVVARAWHALADRPSPKRGA